MAMKLFLIFFFFMLLHFSPVENHPTITVAPSPSPSPSPLATPTANQPSYGHTPGSLKPQECSGRCTFRCSKTQYRKPCMFFCQKCCNKCLCVPAGTYGNKQSCPCYNNWKTKRGGPKCP